MQHLEQYINGTKPVLIEFYTTWSESCKQMELVLQEVKQTAGNRAVFVKVDTEEFSEWIEKYGIYKIPTLMIFKAGKVVWRKSGPVAAREVLDHLSLLMV